MQVMFLFFTKTFFGVRQKEENLSIQVRRKLSKSGTANKCHENFVYTKEVGCRMNIEANAEHTA